MNNYFKRLVRLNLGLILFAIGTYLSIQANIGLAPWSAFSLGVANSTNLTYGDVSIITSVVIIIIDLVLGEKIGIGTILDAILIGKVVDLLVFIDIIPLMNNFLLGVLVLLLGQLIVCIGSYYYIGAAFGCGPRDALMMALGKKLRKIPIGVVRGLLEGSVLVIGWILGAKVGIGTVISVFGIGIIMEYTFKFLKFDVRGIENESLTESVKNILGIIKEVKKDSDEETNVEN